MMRTMVYVTSFSEERDQLSQWRGYCGNAAGFSIGFNLAKLKELLKRTPNTDILLKKRIYEPRIKAAKMGQIIKAAKSTELKKYTFFHFGPENDVDSSLFQRRVVQRRKGVAAGFYCGRKKSLSGR
jgi:hypothetical protein